jgi:hypothetical protein
VNFQASCTAATDHPLVAQSFLRPLPVYCLSYSVRVPCTQDSYLHCNETHSLVGMGLTVPGRLARCGTFHSCSWCYDMSGARNTD